MGSATKIVEHKCLSGKLPTKPVVYELEPAVTTDKYVLHLQVPMHYLQTVQILQSFSHLLRYSPRHSLTHSRSLPQPICQRPIVAQFSN